MLHIRKAAELGWEFGGAPRGNDWAGIRHVDAANGGTAPHRRLGSRAVDPAVHVVSGVRRCPLVGAAARRGSTLAQASAYHVLSSESMFGIPLQAFAETVIGFLVFGTALMMTGAGKFFINLSFALCGTFRGGAAKVGIFASALLGMMSGIDRRQRADRRHDDDPGHEEERLSRVVRLPPSKPVRRPVRCSRHR